MCSGPLNSRREFLEGKSARDALAQFAAAGDSTSPAASAPPDSAYLISVKRRAMACDFEVSLPAAASSAGTEAAMAGLDLVEQIEAQLTVYRDTSELAAINQAAASADVPVEAKLFALLESCARLAAETDGAFDITAGPLSKVWGFYRRQGAVPTDEDLAAARARVGYQHLRLDSTNQTLRFERPGIELNLGGIGKGYALDLAASEIEASGAADFLLHGGRSSVIARGNAPTESEPGGWLVGVRDPTRPDRRLTTIRLSDQALATSGSLTQFFRHDGRRYGHILDPRTGRPAETMLSATVISTSAAEADALSTAFYVMTVEEVRRFCAERPHLGVLLVPAADGHRPAPQVLIGLEQRDGHLVTPQISSRPAAAPGADSDDSSPARAGQNTDLTQR